MFGPAPRAAAIKKGSLVRDFSWRRFAVVVVLVVLAAACGDDSETTSPETPAPSTAAAGRPDTAATNPSGDSETHGHDHSHDHTHGAATTPAVEPHPSVSVHILEDPSGGWLLHTAPTNFRLAPENVSTEHVDGEGHMHLYVDGVKVMRLYGEWHQMPPLTAGVHEIRVELSSNDHSAMSINGVIVDDTVTLEVSEDEATLEADDSTAGTHSHEHDMSGMDSADAGSMEETESSEVDVADAAQTISVEIVGGEPVGGHQRVDVDLNAEVAIVVTSDTAEEVHVHGYDLLYAVAVGQPLEFRFVADIPGVFEVELEGSGRLLLHLTVS